MQLAFGYTQEDMKGDALAARSERGGTIGSMATTRRSPCSQPAPLLYSYFKQLFAQVTNPPIDSVARGS